MNRFKSIRAAVGYDDRSTCSVCNTPVNPGLYAFVTLCIDGAPYKETCECSKCFRRKRRGIKIHDYKRISLQLLYGVLNNKQEKL